MLRIMKLPVMISHPTAFTANAPLHSRLLNPFAVDLLTRSGSVKDNQRKLRGWVCKWWKVKEIWHSERQGGPCEDKYFSSEGRNGARVIKSNCNKHTVLINLTSAYHVWKIHTWNFNTEKRTEKLFTKKKVPVIDDRAAVECHWIFVWTYFWRTIS